jgi:hypothetical protein
MKATPSQDGELRFDIVIRRRIGLQDMVDGLGWNLIRDGTFDTDNKALAVEAALKPYWSRKAVIEAATKAIRHDGYDVWVWADDCSDKLQNEILKQARTLIFKKFPELKPKAVQS